MIKPSINKERVCANKRCLVSQEMTTGYFKKDAHSELKVVVIQLNMIDSIEQRIPSILRVLHRHINKLCELSLFVKRKQ